MGSLHVKNVALYLSSTSNHNVGTVTGTKLGVALYLSSTSNHNRPVLTLLEVLVALYLSSTSNHNHLLRLVRLRLVALYLSSTSNHNSTMSAQLSSVLRYIFLLHQTTTTMERKQDFLSCVISFFYIKPQLDK